MSEQHKQFLLARGTKQQGTQNRYGVLHLHAKLPLCQTTSFYSDFVCKQSAKRLAAEIDCYNSFFKIRWESKQRQEKSWSNFAIESSKSFCCYK